MNGVFSTFSSSSTSAATAFAHSWWEWPQDDLGLEEQSTGHQQSCVEMISASGEVPGAWHPSLHSQFWDPRHHLSAPWAPCVTCPCTLNHSIARGIEFKFSVDTDMSFTFLRCFAVPDPDFSGTALMEGTGHWIDGCV